MSADYSDRLRGPTSMAPSLANSLASIAAQRWYEPQMAEDLPSVDLLCRTVSSARVCGELQIRESPLSRVPGSEVFTSVWDKVSGQISAKCLICRQKVTHAFCMAISSDRPQPGLRVDLPVLRRSWRVANAHALTI